MYRIDTAASATSPTLPAPAAAQAESYFTDHTNPGTQVTADWLNMVQEEIRNAVVAGGQVPSKTAFNQLALAIEAIAAAASAPSGSMTMFGGAAAPAGWLPCDGRAVSRATYAALFAAIGTAFGPGDGSTSFNLPDMRGEFPRGADNGRGVDPGRVLGSTQADSLASHNHKNGVDISGSSGSIFPYGETAADLPGSASSTAHTDSNSPAEQGFTSSTGGSETRPKNVAVNFIIKT